MTALPDAFAAALADRYRLERELGRGGMATVYLARDLRHDRPVALKVLRPEVALAVGPERFLQEIRISARLHHPHLLTVHDSGETAGRLWYTMPAIEGESLRQRLAREGHLPLELALRIATQVLGALGYAHAHGVVHRDIKPENILLQGDDALVADFGVARAIASAGEDRLTESGLAVGTPAYMSPEQGTAARELDGRSDLYALACVLYEMLAGQPPFTGATAQQLLARHAVDPVPSLHTVRTTVPLAVEQAVTRALAKLPADRFPDAARFAEALVLPREGGMTPASPVPVSQPSRGWRRPALVAAAVLVLGVIGYLVRRTPTTALDPARVAVLPFRVGGAAPELAYLREGMMDLVAVRLTGEGGARAADPGAVMAAWRHAARADVEELSEPAALDLARRLGAGQLLVGGVVGTPGHVVLTATLRSERSTRVEAKVEGAVDSLPQLVDRLIAQLLTGRAGASRGLEGLIDVPLPALRSFLEARAAQRRGEYDAAVAGYRQALDRDSTFGLAGLGLATAAGWTVAPGAARRGLELAWASRDRLSEAERALVLAEVGPAFPDISTLAQHLPAWEHALDLAPDQPDRWYELGDAYYHEGPYLGMPSAHQRAAEAFRRSVAIDSGTSPLGHLVELAAEDHDTAEVRRLGALYLARDTSGELLGFYRWRIARGLGDAATLEALRGEYGRLGLQSLWRIMNYAVLDGDGLADADTAARAIRTAAGRGAEWERSKTYLHAYYSNRGRPAAALADSAAPEDTEYGPHAALYQRVLDALYGDGDSASARAAVAELGRALAGPPSAAPVAQATAQTDRCVVTLWALSLGDRTGAEAAITRLRADAPQESPADRATRRACATLLEAKLAAATGGPGAAAAVDRLDALMRSGPSGGRNGPPVAFTLSPAYVRATVGISPVAFEDFANLEVARLREQQGDLRAALAAVRRRPYAYHLTDYLAAHLREQGRLAALLGERAAAIRAFEHYLALRSAPEPSVRPVVEAVRQELARLEAP